jgi:hypothetical protein
LLIEEIKEEIEDKHPLKPKPSKQKLFFAGKLLTNEQSLKDVLGQVLFIIKIIYM